MWINWEIWLVKSHVTTSLYSRVVYILEWRHPYSSVNCTEYPPNSGHVFLPEWYVKKLPPPTDWESDSSFIFYIHYLWTFQILLGFNPLAHTLHHSDWESFSFVFFFMHAFHHSLSVNCFFQLWWYTAQSHPLTLLWSHSRPPEHLYQLHTELWEPWNSTLDLMFP